MVFSTTAPESLSNAQALLLPGIHSWQQFKALQTWAEHLPGLRITYLDGHIELTTTGKPHERIKKFLAILVELYCFEAGIRFFPAGNATCADVGFPSSTQPTKLRNLSNINIWVCNI
jgi:Uma2 family endonuclease